MKFFAEKIKGINLKKSWNIWSVFFEKIVFILLKGIDNKIVGGKYAGGSRASCSYDAQTAASFFCFI